MDRPKHKPALCNRCVHMGEAVQAHYRQNYVACSAPVMVPIVLRMNGFFHESPFDRLIPRRVLVGFEDASQYDRCHTFTPRIPKVEPAPTPQTLPARNPALVDMLKHFMPEKHDG